MDDMTDAESMPRDWFAELTARIPSFVGYQANLREILSDVIEKANDAETSVVDDLSKIIRTMNELRDKVEFLGYGDTTFFTDEQLDPDILSKVYQLETQIYDSLDGLETAFESPKDLGRRDTLRDIRKRLETILQDFAARKETMKSLR
ncbi:MAG: hypothetical protein NTZ77_05750 [Caldiserica bacterium]|nr:hypothetical protein [Caldisericota bacterium]